jgi:hypothetical protein
MGRFRQHSENDLADRFCGMRAAVLGAINDIISTASLIV